MTQTIIGAFSERAEADTALSQLHELGYRPQDISIIMKDGNSTTTIHRDKSTNIVGSTTAGATAGGALAAIAGLLVGIGAIAVPGIGALFIGGPIAASLGLTGAAATTVAAATSGVLAGGLVGALVGYGLPEEVAKTYESHLKEGAIVLAVPINNIADHAQVEEVFDNNHAVQVRSITHGQ